MDNEQRFREARAAIGRLLLSPLPDKAAILIEEALLKLELASYELTKSDTAITLGGHGET